MVRYGEFTLFALGAVVAFFLALDFVALSSVEFAAVFALCLFFFLQLYCIDCLLVLAFAISVAWMVSYVLARSSSVNKFMFEVSFLKHSSMNFGTP